MAKKAPNPIDRHVGSRVRMRRMMLSMSQEKLGDALGLTFQQVQKYEKGANRIGASRLQHIAGILQVPVSFFFGRVSQRTKVKRRNGLNEAPSPAYVSDFLATSDGLALTKRFRPHQGRQAAAAHRRSRGTDCRAEDKRADAHSCDGGYAGQEYCKSLPTGCPHIDCISGRCLKRGQNSTDAAVMPVFPSGVQAWRNEAIIFSRVSPFLKGILTRSPIRSPMRILDAFLENDIKLGISDDSLVNTRLGCETLTTTNKIVIAGEGRGQAPLFKKYGRRPSSTASRSPRSRARS